MSITPSEIRQLMRRKRRSLSGKVQREHAQKLSQTLSRSNLFRYSNKLAFYLANDGEIDTTFIIQKAWNMGKKIYLPVLSPLKKQLYFAPYHPDSKMITNRFGISEPACYKRDWLSAKQLDTVFMPLVAFDEQGNRIGMGGGFYDRSLAYLATRAICKGPKLIGLAHEIQLQNNIPGEQWDIPLNMIVTEKRIIRI